MRRVPPPEDPSHRRLRRELPRPEGPFDRLLRRRAERDPAPIIIGGTIAFLALVIILVFAFSSIFGGGGDGTTSGTSGRTSDTVEVAPGIRGRLAKIPGLPAGLAAVSEFIEFETEEDIPAIIGLPLKQRVVEPAGLGFYTFFEGRWQRLADAKVEQDGSVASGDFSSVPRNLAVLRVLAQTYQVAASLPHGGSLHADARVNVVSPRDYAPSADAAVQGQATGVSSGGAFAVMPTVVGSSQDTAAIVNDILADESLRARHVQAIVSLVKGGPFEGIDLEYSSVDADLKAEFTAFVTALADGLHAADKKLSLTLPPPTNQRQAYDWKALGQSADVIKILPIADPVTYWETMPDALGAVTEEIDPHKVMLVVSPFSVEEAGNSARPIGYVQAMALAGEAAVREPQNPDALKPGVTVRLVAKNLDEGEGASPVRWNDDAVAVSFATGGNDRRRIFIENTYSFGFKLELVQAYGLAGVAVSDGSGQSDVANVWSAVNELITAATVSLKRPNESMLMPIWQAPEGGDLGAGAGTTATWVAPASGQYNVVLVVSDGERRFGRQTLIEVKPSNEPSPSPFQTFAPETPTPTASATPEESETPTPGPGELLVEVGKIADGDDENPTFTNDETVTPASEVTYLITIDNDSSVPVTVSSLVDDIYPDATCLTVTGKDVIGVELDPDDGDGTGLQDGGVDQVQCAFTATAPSGSGVTVTDTVKGVVTDANGDDATDQDIATITTS
ncbi:MAG: glycosyl hydrolase family 18 protein [Dehalococcoidia bacterium]|nr:glycosyl hydrolase family 18 protein [Dehalococcoidia bacterium]